MAVPPERPVLLGADGEVVDEVAAGGDGTLREAHSAVHGVAAHQAQTVPVERDTLVVEAIVDVDDEPVA